MASEYDFCFAWNWPYDCDFVNILDQACQDKSVSLYQVTPENLTPTIDALMSEEINFFAYLDRASDADDSFAPLASWAREQDALRINCSQQARRAWDKAAMHRRFTRAGLGAPFTYILPSFLEQPDLAPLDLAPLGGCFAVKPAHGGGGDGVHTGLTQWEEVLAARLECPEDRYLLQSHVIPAQIEGKAAWFRIIYCTGQIFVCWWDPYTHIYIPMTEAEIQRLNLCPLLEIPEKMARLCRMELFSSEIAFTPSGQFLIVDYVNDPVDLRLQSKAAEGVPDHVVEMVAHELTSFVARRRESTRLWSLELNTF